jgi:competence protein ComEC
MHKRELLLLAAGVLVMGNVVLWSFLLLPHPHILTVSFLDIGQGDSILVKGPTGKEMLIDGGPDRSVLRELPTVIGPLDRSLDLVVETHPDADHITGLTYVFDRYQVGTFMEPGRPDETLVSATLDADVAKEPNLTHILGRAGQRIDLGGGAYADILSPGGDVSQIPTNNASIVMRVVYGTTSFMLTGDAPSPIEDYLVGKDGTALKSDILKAGHHGSKYSTDDLWLATVHPSVVVISAGKGNTYGHPNSEAVSRIQNEGAKIVSTIDSGTITFSSDGNKLWER